MTLVDSWWSWYYRGPIKMALRAGAESVRVNPDIAEAVRCAQAVLPEHLRDEVRISVTRPSQLGAMARVSISFLGDTKTAVITTAR